MDYDKKGVVTLMCGIVDKTVSPTTVRKWAIRPLSLKIWTPSTFTTAIPAESYPRYSNFSNPFNKISLTLTTKLEKR